MALSGYFCLMKSCMMVCSETWEPTANLRFNCFSMRDSISWSSSVVKPSAPGIFEIKLLLFCETFRFCKIKLLLILTSYVKPLALAKFKVKWLLILTSHDLGVKTQPKKVTAVLTRCKELRFFYNFHITVFVCDISNLTNCVWR